MSLNRRHCSTLALTLLALSNAAWGDGNTETSDRRLEQAANCATNDSQLERLHCYDNLFRHATDGPTGDDPRPPQWYAVEALEQARGDQDFGFRRARRADGDILMSAPALGTTAPRPRLVISCEDTITRFQLHLDTPLDEGRTHLRLRTPGRDVTQPWRIRDGGYVVSGGRGLPAIDTLRRLVDAGTLTLGSDIPALDGLRFDLTELRARIAPLREACRW